jgi:hypothetical protein
MKEKLTANGENGRVVDIRDYESKLGARMPPLRCLLWLCIIEINGHRIVWRCIGVSEWKKQYAPLSTE